MKKSPASAAQRGFPQLSDKEWGSLEETLYLLSIPGMRESIQEGMATPIEECIEELKLL